MWWTELILFVIDSTGCISRKNRWLWEGWPAFQAITIYVLRALFGRVQYFGSHKFMLPKNLNVDSKTNPCGTMCLCSTYTSILRRMQHLRIYKDITISWLQPSTNSSYLSQLSNIERNLLISAKQESIYTTMKKGWFHQDLKFQRGIWLYMLGRTRGGALLFRYPTWISLHFKSC